MLFRLYLRPHSGQRRPSCEAQSREVQLLGMATNLPFEVARYCFVCVSGNTRSARLIRRHGASTHHGSTISRHTRFAGLLNEAKLTRERSVNMLRATLRELGIELNEIPVTKLSRTLRSNISACGEEKLFRRQKRCIPVNHHSIGDLNGALRNVVTHCYCYCLCRISISKVARLHVYVPCVSCAQKDARFWYESFSIPF